MTSTVNTKNAPAAIGPYSQATIFQDLIFISGQIPLDPKTMTVVSENIENQTKQVLSNLNAILEAAESSISKVVKTTIYIKNMDDFNKINSIYRSFFKDNTPARATIEVSRLPKDVKIEIDAIAHK